MVFWGIMPKDAPLGALWTDQDTLKMYVHTGGGTWAQVAHCAGDEIIDEHYTYIEYTKYAYGVSAVNHNGQSITGGMIDIYWDSTEGKDYYDGDYYWEVDMLGDDTWVKHEDLPQEFLDKINFRWEGNSRYAYEAAPNSTSFDGHVNTLIILVQEQESLVVTTARLMMRTLQSLLQKLHQCSLTITIAVRNPPLLTNTSLSVIHEFSRSKRNN